MPSSSPALDTDASAPAAQVNPCGDLGSVHRWSLGSVPGVTQEPAPVPFHPCLQLPVCPASLGREEPGWVCFHAAQAALSEAEGAGFPRAPPQSGAQRPHRAGRSRGELTSRCSSAKEGAPNRSTARVVGLWQPSPALPASTEPGPTLRFCTCCLRVLLPGTGPCSAFQPNTGRGLGWKWESGFPL